MNISDNGTKFIATEEGFREDVYLDQANLPTVGVGHLLTDDEKSKWPIGTIVDKPTLQTLFESDNETAIKSINQYVTHPINQNQFDALCSLTFNIGVGAFKSSTLLKKLNKGDIPGAADQFLVWNKITKNGKKVVSEGLSNRRQRERTLFLTPDITNTTNTTK